MFSGKGIDLCNPEDPICHAGPGNEWSGHTNMPPGWDASAPGFDPSLVTGLP